LARLQKDYEILVNKVKFIQGVVSESLRINKVKRRDLIRKMVAFGLMPMSEIHKIMLKFAHVGPQAHQRPIKAAAEGVEEEEPSGELVEEQEVEGEVSAKEFEYLLSMPMWSVTEERVDLLIKQMHEKKLEHDALLQKSIPDLWTEDLDAFLVELEKVWEQEEQDRLKHGGVKNDGKKKRKAPPAKKGKTRGDGADENEYEPVRKKPLSKKQAKPKAAAEETKKALEEMTLRERLAMKFGKDMQMEKPSMFSGRDGLTAAQLESKRLGLGHKKSAKETTIFDDLNDMASRYQDSDEEASYRPVPRDMAQRRRYATVEMEEEALAAASKARAQPRPRRNV